MFLPQRIRIVLHKGEKIFHSAIYDKFSADERYSLLVDKMKRKISSMSSEDLCFTFHVSRFSNSCIPAFNNFKYICNRIILVSDRPNYKQRILKK